MGVPIGIAVGSVVVLHGEDRHATILACNRSAGAVRPSDINQQ
jgi:hypothetical protein